MVRRIRHKRKSSDLDRMSGRLLLRTDHLMTVKRIPDYFKGNLLKGSHHYGIRRRLSDLIAGFMLMFGFQGLSYCFPVRRFPLGSLHDR